MKKIGMFIVSAVAAAFATVMMLNVTSVGAEEAPVSCMADVVRELTMENHMSTVTYDDGVVCIEFGWRIDARPYWEEVYNYFSEEEREELHQACLEHGLTWSEYVDYQCNWHVAAPSVQYNPFNTSIWI